jgi:hypothetical protein
MVQLGAWGNASGWRQRRGPLLGQHVVPADRLLDLLAKLRRFLRVGLGGRLRVVGRTMAAALMNFLSHPNSACGAAMLVSSLTLSA